MGSNGDLWRQSLDVEEKIKLEFTKWGLNDWYFFWDKGKRRLGACWYIKRAISLSKYLLGGDADREAELWNTFLHELAHALAYTFDQEPGHGYYWKKWCLQLGTSPERQASKSPIDDSAYRFAIRRKDTGEIVARYFRKPHFKHPMKKLMIKGFPETKGQLEIIPYPSEESDFPA